MRVRGEGERFTALGDKSLLPPAMNLGSFTDFLGKLWVAPKIGVNSHIQKNINYK